MYYNKNGFLSLSSFDSLGFTSISKIVNYDACKNYILKYINKDMCSALKGQHLYFCSRGLKRSFSVLKFYSSDIQPLRFDYKSPYVYKKDFSQEQLKNYLTTIFQLDKIYYVFNNR